MQRLLRELRYAWRRVVASPGQSAVIFVTLALGIGVNVAIFSLVNAMLLRPLPYPEPERLVTVNHYYPSVNLVSNVSVRGFLEYRDTTTTFDRVAATTGWITNLSGIGQPERLIGGRVSHDYFDVFGASPALGRTFLPAEDAPDGGRVLIVSHAFWNSRLGADPDVLGRTLQLNGESYTVVGVMPAGFRDYFGRTRQLWKPLALTADQLANRSVILEWLRLAARLAPDATIDGARSELAAVAERFKAEFPGLIPDSWQITVTSLDERAKAGARPSLLLLTAAVGLLLLLTCANVANLVLTRSIRRRSEIALRGALGASPGDLAGMLVTESLVLAGAGGVAGLALAWASVRAIVALGPPEYGLAGVEIDGTVLAYATLLSLATGLLFGLVPAAQASRLDLQGILRDAVTGTARSGRLRKVLVAAEFAIAVILLIGSGLLMRTMAGLQRVEPGFDTANVLTANITIPEARYPDAGSHIAFFDQVIARLEALPGVETAATLSHVPFSGSWSTSIFNVEGYVPDDDHPRPWGDMRFAGPGLDRALGLPVLRGRFFDHTDTRDSMPVVVVDQIMAEQFWPEEDPIGKRVLFGNPQDPNAIWFTVVGVVGHALQQNLVEDTRVQVYRCSRQIPDNDANLVIRTNVEPLSLVRALRKAVLSVDDSQPVARVATLDDLVAESIGDRRATMLLLTVFAGLAALLASVGIYGVMSHTVAERRRELGIRMTCGATGPALLRMVVGHGMALAAIGTGVGVAVLPLIGRSIQGLLYQISPLDPATLATVAALILLVAAVSILLPAVRAARSDPLVCMRGR